MKERHTRRNYFSTWAATFLLLAAVAPQTVEANTPMSPEGSSVSEVDDKKFVKDAALGAMTEVELGKLAQQKASSSDVRQFGQRMVEDHTKAQEALRQVASAESIDVPAALDSKHRERIDKLAKLEGAAFDRAYLKDQLKDHRNDLSDFNDEAQGGSDARVKAFASATLPALQERLELVKNLNKASKSQ